MDATVALLNVEYVTAVCLYIYTIAGTMTGSWKVLLGSWKSPGIYFGQDSGNPSFDMGLLEARDAVQNRSFWRMLILHSAMHSLLLADIGLAPID